MQTGVQLFLSILIIVLTVFLKAHTCEVATCSCSSKKARNSECRAKNSLLVTEFWERTSSPCGFFIPILRLMRVPKHIIEEFRTPQLDTVKISAIQNSHTV